MAIANTPDPYQQLLNKLEQRRSDAMDDGDIQQYLAADAAFNQLINSKSAVNSLSQLHPRPPQTAYQWVGTNTSMVSSMVYGVNGVNRILTADFEETELESKVDRAYNCLRELSKYPKRMTFGRNPINTELRRAIRGLCK